MVLSIKNILNNYGVDGDIILYRDPDHKKKGLLAYIASKLDSDGKTICTFSDGAFGLFTARQFSNNEVITCFRGLSPDYGELMEATENLTLVPGTNGLPSWKKFCEGKDYLCINQFEDEIVKEYYAKHFPVLIEALKDYPIDAFCDCGHSCATMAGFIESGLVDWQFILGINLLDKKRLHCNHLEPMLDKFVQVTTKKFDTLKLGKEIEAAYPEFGNVYEATRSISAAMAWLQENPGKTVAVYVGDSFEKEGTKFGQDK